MEGRLAEVRVREKRELPRLPPENDQPAFTSFPSYWTEYLHRTPSQDESSGPYLDYP